MIVQRIGTAELLFNTAERMGLSPSWVLPEKLFAVSINGEEEYINFACSMLNTEVAASLARNKHSTRMILARHNVLNIPFLQAETVQDAHSFLTKYKKVIAKPLGGSGSRDIHVITDPDQLASLAIDNYILEEYVAGRELRYLVLNDSIIAVHESQYGTSVAADRALKRVSYSKETWDSQLCKESLRIARILKLRFAAIDYIIDAEGRSHLLEVNTAPGLKWFHAPSSGPAVDVARHLLEAMYEPQMTYTATDLQLTRHRGGG